MSLRLQPETFLTSQKKHLKGRLPGVRRAEMGSQSESALESTLSGPHPPGSGEQEAPKRTAQPVRRPHQGP